MLKTDPEERNVMNKVVRSIIALVDNEDINIVDLAVSLQIDVASIGSPRTVFIARQI